MNLSEVISSLKGLTGGAPVFQELFRLSDKGAITPPTMEPGDFASKDRVMAAPLAPDLWYIFNHVNLLTWVVPDTDEPDSFMDRRLSFFSSKLAGIKPLQGIVSVGDVVGSREWFTNKMEWINEAHDWVQLLAFEIRFKNQPFQYSTEVKMPNSAVGYIMIPIGGPGVIEVISLVQETITEIPGFVIPYEERPKTINDGIDTMTNLFPPTSGWVLNQCYGRHLLESCYVIPETEKTKVLMESRYHIKMGPLMVVNSSGDLEEINGQGLGREIDIPMESIYGKGVNTDGSRNEDQPGKVIKPKNWMRVWITREDKWPIPGEFIGILIKPSPIPPHVWWFMRSSPLLYAGNWMDTLDLTSGLIKSKESDITHPESGSLCTRYVITIHGIDIQVYSSDFIEYDIGTRVAVWKNRKDEVANNYDDRVNRSFDQREQQQYGDPLETDPAEDYTIYVILPITFFL